MSTNVRARTCSVAAAIFGLLLSANPLDLRAEEPKAGGTLIWSLAATPRHLNPAVQSGISTGQPGAQIFAAPIRYDENWNPHPYLAKSWETSEDGLTVTLNLVEGATFHDGMRSPRRTLPSRSRRSRRIIPSRPCSGRSSRLRRPMRRPLSSSFPSRTRHCSSPCRRSCSRSFRSTSMAMARIPRPIRATAKTWSVPGPSSSSSSSATST